LFGIPKDLNESQRLDLQRWCVATFGSAILPPIAHCLVLISHSTYDMANIVPDLYIFSFVVASAIWFDDYRRTKQHEKSSVSIIAYFLAILCVMQYALLLPVGPASVTVGWAEGILLAVLVGSTVWSGLDAGVRSVKRSNAGRSAGG
jgi:UDP-N-acetylmuramyl pentapeptide phosphotransferase/UDP-N-acetylglucosamine-1-phosphate transferase